MDILEDLNQKIIQMYKSGDERTRVFLQTLKAAIIQKQKDGKTDLTDEDIKKILKIELKQRQEAFLQYKSQNREDLCDKIKFEIDYLENMLPQQLSDEKIEKVVIKIIGESEDKSFPTIMKQVMGQIGSNADGSLVAQIVKRHLS